MIHNEAAVNAMVGATKKELEILTPDKVVVDVDYARNRLENVINHGGSSWERNYWEEVADQIQSVDRHKLGNLAYRRI